MRLTIFILPMFVLSSIALAQIAPQTMYIRVYHERQTADDDAEAYPYGSQLAKELNDPGLTTLNLTPLPCGREGRYYAAVWSEPPPSQSHVVDGLWTTPCDGISGDYMYVKNCFLYGVDFDDNEGFCTQTSPSCMRDINGNERYGVWESEADNRQGECCGDDYGGINPDGTDHTMDDPDMGPISCENCTVGLNAKTDITQPPLRDWGLNVPAGQGCCGDDEDDCHSLAGGDKWLCWQLGADYAPTTHLTNPFNPNNQMVEPGVSLKDRWFWSSAGPVPGAIVNVSCSKRTAVSDGNRWITCDYSSYPAPPDMTCVYSIDRPTNGHLSVCGEGDYELHCAAETGTLDCSFKQECDSSETAVLQLSGTTNAHVAMPDEPANYTTRLCCSIDGNPIHISETGTKPQYIVSLARYINSHAAYDPPYGTKLYFADDVSCALLPKDSYPGPAFGDEVDNPHTIQGHQYLCTHAGNPMISECCGGTAENPGTLDDCYTIVETDTEDIHFGGIPTNTGGSVEHYFVGVNKTYYCTSEFSWTEDLDVLDEYTCTQAGLHWTGTYCCSEAEDLEEFYNDRAGICWNNTFFKNDSIVAWLDHTYEELYVHDGVLRGCAIDEDNAGAPQGYYSRDPHKPYNGSLATSNDWLLTIRDYPDPKDNKNYDTGKQQLIEDNDYCTVYGPSGEPARYYCSYREIWVDGEGENRSHLSYINWTPLEDTVQRAECCERYECWDGTQCVDSFHVDAGKPPFTTPDGRELRCVFGDWTDSAPKLNWNKKLAGYCLEETQCLVDPDGDFENNDKPEYYVREGHPDNPQCISDGQFIQDHYCEKGNWTTRTKFLVLQLLNFAGDNDFTMFCDTYERSLNQYEYSLRQYSHPGTGCPALGTDENEVYRVYMGSDRRPGCPTNCTAGVGSSRQEVDCANSFCAMHTQGRTLIATTLNQPLNSPYYPFLDVIGKSSCSVQQDDQYHSCGDGGVWYNHELQSVIFSTDSFSLGATNWWGAFKGLVGSWISSIVQFFTGNPIVPASDYPFVTENPQIQRMFYDSHGDKEVFALLEENIYYSGQPDYPPQDYLSVSYNGFNVNICDAFAAYPGLEADVSPVDSRYRCEATGADSYHLIAETGSPVFELWNDFTAKLRVQ